MKAILPERFVLMGKKSMINAIIETALLSGTVFQNPRSQFFNVDTTSELAFGLENRGMEETQILKKVDKTVQELKLEKLMNRAFLICQVVKNENCLWMRICLLTEYYHFG